MAAAAIARDRRLWRRRAGFQMHRPHGEAGRSRATVPTRQPLDQSSHSRRGRTSQRVPPAWVFGGHPALMANGSMRRILLSGGVIAGTTAALALPGVASAEGAGSVTPDTVKPGGSVTFSTVCPD